MILSFSVICKFLLFFSMLQAKQGRKIEGNSVSPILLGFSHDDVEGCSYEENGCYR